MIQSTPDCVVRYKWSYVHVHIYKTRKQSKPAHLRQGNVIR